MAEESHYETDAGIYLPAGGYHGSCYAAILSELIQEILDIFNKLLEIGDFKNANHLLNTLENKTQMNNYAKLLFAQLKI